MMRAKLVIVAAFLWLVSSSLGFAVQPKPEAKYTTLVVEYVGEMDRFVPPVLITTSLEEGEWYRQHLLPEPIRFLVVIDVVPSLVLDEITESPLLKRQLAMAKPVDDEPKMPQNVRFTAGVGYDHVQIMVDAQKSTKIMKDIAELIAKYPTLKSELQEIEDQVKTGG